jgi:hypothetical protein
MSELRVKGSVLRARLAFVEERGGREGLARVLESLGAGDRATLQIVLASSWYPFDLGARPRPPGT